MIGLIKILAVSIYYVVFLVFEKWVNAGYFGLAAAALLAGITAGKRGKKIGFPVKGSAAGGLLILYAGVVIWVVQMGGLAPTSWEVLLQSFYYLVVCLCLMAIGNRVFLQMKAEAGRNNQTAVGEAKLNSRMYKIISGIFVVLLIPVLGICPYVHARADDNAFGRYVHWAWEDGGSLLEILQAAFTMIKEAYFGWQGSYSSIFMMAFQPAVFDERAYCIVPILFITLIVISSYFFLSTFLREVLHADKSQSKACIWVYLLLAVQCIPVKQSAYLWYNGAVHYIAAHCVFLCMLAFIVRMQKGKRQWSNWLGAALCAVYVGGANYVTMVGTLLLVLTFFFYLTVQKKWKEYKNVTGICIVYLAAMLLNMIAPGNMNKMNNMTQGYSFIKAFMLAFVKSMEYMLGEWMHWSVFVFAAVCIPIAWKIVKNTEFKFPYPLLAVGYSWCYMAALFFAPLFTITTVSVGRFQNAMFLQWILILLLDIIYVTGWIQKKYPNLAKVSYFQKEKQYFVWIGAFTIIVGILSVAAEPEHYLTTQAIEILQDENLEAYERDYWENIEILKSEEPEVTIHNLENRPEFLEVEETEAWNSGLRPFYRKEKVTLE